MIAHSRDEQTLRLDFAEYTMHASMHDTSVGIVQLRVERARTGDAKKNAVLHGTGAIGSVG